MRREITLRHEFVEYIPDQLKEGTIYVSVRFATVVHKCCCGCGNEVVTPLSPADWKLTFDGQSITLDPSIGNYNFACRSHYWIRGDKAKWAPRWMPKEVAVAGTSDGSAKEKSFTGSNDKKPVGAKTKNGLWRKLKEWLFPPG